MKKSDHFIYDNLFLLSKSRLDSSKKRNFAFRMQTSLFAFKDFFLHFKHSILAHCVIYQKTMGIGDSMAVTGILSQPAIILTFFQSSFCNKNSSSNVLASALRKVNYDFIIYNSIVCTSVCVCGAPGDFDYD